MSEDKKMTAAEAWAEYDARREDVKNAPENSDALAAAFNAKVAAFHRARAIGPRPEVPS